ncbi:fumarylacetoacetate (FAA) hydrolase family protein [Paraburkholderia xenovorans LB400]|uniref:Fumarylacetoacetate hydrolase n=1 Tax=Paraburkholderia xenovorans (strain LB400) TaxID=266265 RepID=Q13GK9_PARXL|nr:fumarylacetoacetate hydrolase family protein [Paraburkholderia xenovorans]ABE36780.1 Putative fumarylacetoacetate hydrolase [Paraburkholderia xenovorans LB400]AIP34994.1 fumarylacetoacetate (FAA) hydrolase family protein [Paraburkholderia xenovorans LB400]
MKLASLTASSRDGQLIVVSTDLRRAVLAGSAAPTLRAALDDWLVCQPELQRLSDALNADRAAGAFDFDPAQCGAPLPRTHQFVDASAFLNHGRIMTEAYQLANKPDTVVPVLIQRQGDDFRGPLDDYAFPTEDDQCDFEGEIGAILDDVPQGTATADALSHIKLFTLFNDVSMRGHLFREMSLGFGFIQAKPATAFAAVAVTPDELGDAWANARVNLDLHVQRNGKAVGHPNGREMSFGFDQLIAHFAYNRNLRAGTIIGTGTFSNADYATVGSACLAEQRAIERIRTGESTTPWIGFGERLRFEMFDAHGASIFGAIDHRFVPVNKEVSG